MEHFYLKENITLIKNQLPHNILAEKIILSCLINNSDLLDSLTSRLPIEAFYFKNHQEIYKSLIFLHRNKKPVDTVILITFLKDNGLLDQIGGTSTLADLLNQSPNLANFEEYLLLLVEKYKRRVLIKIGYEIINSGYITNISLKSIFNELEQKFFNLTSSLNPKNSLSNVSLLESIFKELREKASNPKLPGLASGFYDLDAITQGFQKSDLIILAGRPSMGKTALGLNFSINIIKYLRLPVLFFSLEMSKKQIMCRLLAMEANIDQIKLKTGKLYHNDWLKLTKLIAIFSKLPLFIDDSFNITIQDIRSKIKSIIFDQKQLGLIVIDYIQLMQNSKLKTETRAQELSYITRSLKSLAREFNVPIIALSQLSRGIETRLDKKPLLSDLRESGSLEQDADLVMFLNKNNVLQPANINSRENQLIDLIIAKHRNGPIGTVQLNFTPQRTKFFNIAKQSAQNQD